MKHRSEPTSPSTSRRLVRYRIVVWMTLAVIVLGGLFGGTGAQPNGIAPGGLSDSAAQVAYGESAQAADGGAIVGLPFSNAETHARYLESPEKLLLQERWDMSLSSDLGRGDWMKDAIGWVATLGFLISGVIWNLTMALVNFATSSDLLSTFGLLMDRGYAQVTGASAGLVGLLWGVTLWRVGKLSLRGNSVLILKQVAGFIAPISLLFYMGSAANNSIVSNELLANATGGDAAAGYSPSYLPAAGSPSWFSTQIAEKINLAAGEVTGVVTGANFLAGNDGAALDETVGYGNSYYDCSAYINAIFAQYRYYSEAKNGQDAGGSNAVVMQAFSRLWLSSYYDSWAIAQFGETPARHLVACRILEERALITPQEQAEIEAIAPGSPGPANEKVYALQGSHKNEKDDVAAWQRCLWNGSAWTGLGWDGKAPDCAKRWTEGDVGAMGGDASTDGANYDKNEVEQLNRTFNGHNSGERLTSSAVSVAVSGVYAFVFVGISIGALLAQFGLLIGVIFAGLSLMAISIGSSAGARALKLTIGFIGSRALFAVVLGFLVKLTLLSNVIFNYGAAGEIGAAGGAASAGVVGALTAGLSPLLAMLVVNKALASMGMGKLTSLKGSTSMLANMAGKTSGSKSLKQFIGGGGSSRGQGGLLQRAGRGGVDTALRGQRKRQDLKFSRKAAQQDLKVAAKRHKQELAQEEERKRREVTEGTHGALGAGEATAKQSLRDRVAGRAELARERAREMRERLRGKRERAKGIWDRNNENHARDLNQQHVVGETPAAKPAPLGDLSEGKLADLLPPPPRPVSVQPVATNTDPDVARAALEARRREQYVDAKELGTPAAAANARSRLLDELAHTGNTYSGLVGELTQEERQVVRAATAANLGLSERNVIVDRFGNSVVDPTSFSDRTEIPTRLRGLPELCLSNDIVMAIDGEPDHARAERITATLIESGHRYVEGGTVVVSDLYAQAGVDPNSAEAQQLYSDWWGGHDAGAAVKLPLINVAGARHGTVAAVTGTDLGGLRVAPDMWHQAAATSASSLAEVTAALSALDGKLGQLSSALSHMGGSQVDPGRMMGELEAASADAYTALAEASELYSARNNVSGVSIDSDEILERLSAQLNKAWSGKTDDANLDDVGEVLAALGETAKLLGAVGAEVKDLPGIYTERANLAQRHLDAEMLKGSSAPALPRAPIDPRSAPGI